MNENIKELPTLFKDYYGNPLQLAPGQQDIFQAVLTRTPKRNIILAPTQYGKTEAISDALALRVALYPEKWAIVAPSQGKAMIIMQYIISHLFDCPDLLAQLAIDTPLERLKRERSKDRLTFRRGGEIYALTAEARLKAEISKSLMGFGAPNLILDESSLIDDDLYATAKRMVGGHKDNFILEIGNPWNRNHFYRAWNSDAYHKVFIDYKQALAEGRFSPEFIEEMRHEPFFDILYECKFPDPEMVDRRGYRLLVPSAEDFFGEIEPKGRKRLGVDVGRGGDLNVWTIRTDNFAWVEDVNSGGDLMQTAMRTKEIVEKYRIDPKEVFVDDSGVGGGVTDRLHELKAKFPGEKEGETREVEMLVNGVQAGGSPADKERYSNCRAEMYWEARKWLMEGGRLRRHEGFFELERIKYKENTSSQLALEPKEEMLGRGEKSPDFADSFALTFVITPSLSWGIG